MDEPEKPINRAEWPNLFRDMMTDIIDMKIRAKFNDLIDKLDQFLTIEGDKMTATADARYDELEERVQDLAGDHEARLAKLERWHQRKDIIG